MQSESVSISPATILIPVENLHPNPWNKTRWEDGDSPDLNQLTASVAEKGVLSDLWVRPKSIDGDSSEHFEIIAGEGRWRASVNSGKEYCPCKVVHCSDAEAKELTFIENNIRKADHPLSQARALDDLINTIGFDLDQVAKDFGRSASWVRRRAKLLGLIDLWREAWMHGGAKGWPVNHFETLAHFSADQQKALFKDADNVQDWDWLGSPQAFTGWLSERTKSLDMAPFDTEDATLVPKAGACAACPKRSGANEDLFGMVEGVQPKDRCLDGECWAKKLKAHCVALHAATEREHGTCFKVSTAYNPTGGLTKGAILPGDYTPVKAKAKGAVPAVVFHGEGTGTKIWVKMRGTEEEARSGAAGGYSDGDGDEGEGGAAGSMEDTQKRGRGRPKLDSKEKREAELIRRREARYQELLAEYVGADDLVWEEKDKELMFAACIAFEMFEQHGEGKYTESVQNMNAIFERLKKGVPLEEAWAWTKLSLINRIKYDVGSPASDEERKLMANIAWMVGADEAALREQAEKDVPRPEGHKALDGE